jgi:hypothetical protein
VLYRYKLFVTKVRYIVRYIPNQTKPNHIPLFGLVWLVYIIMYISLFGLVWLVYTIYIPTKPNQTEIYIPNQTNPIDGVVDRVRKN